MALPFRPPLTAHELRVQATMPKNEHGQIVDPTYMPPGRREAYERQLRTWAENTPVRDWPQWFADYVARKRWERDRERATATETRAAATGERSTGAGVGPGHSGVDRAGHAGA